MVRLRAEAREAKKLLEDKKILQNKLKESQTVLETVQNQRNDLKQLLKVNEFIAVDDASPSKNTQQNVSWHISHRVI